MGSRRIKKLPTRYVAVVFVERKKEVLTWQFQREEYREPDVTKDGHRFGNYPHLLFPVAQNAVN
jgi:hypothetical protein